MIPRCTIVTPHAHSSLDDPIDCPLRDAKPMFVVHGTPVTRLAGLIVAAIDAGDVAMARRCAQRLIELGGKR